ncbi:MAG: indolepyruvate oxidoreductase subunit beta [Methanobacteriota archaeon]|nr:MAG: indolepyruvate oxidoreductase subunit beta [Euryarchaeota archaeon]
MVDIYLVGVGGQGIITASKIIGSAAMLAGENVVLSETHGMAQRGGSVVCTARIGDSSNPLIRDSGADIILSLELLETARAICKANEDTVFVASTDMIIPLSVSTQNLEYPSFEDIKRRVEAVSRAAVFIDSQKVAEEEGVPMSSNVVMIGALAGTGTTGIDEDLFKEAVGLNIRRNSSENRKAFARGVEAGRIALS